MKKDLVISVSGEVNSGKSRLTYFLKKFLEESGFEVEFDGGLDFENESQFDEHMSKNLDRVLEHIKENRKITLKEIQTNRSFSDGL